MRVTGLSVESLKKGKYLEVTFTGAEGSVVLVFDKKMSRRLMRSIFLKVGLDPKLGRGMDTLPEYKSYKE